MSAQHTPDSGRNDSVVVTVGDRQYVVHFANGEPTDVVVMSKGKPYRNIGTTGPAALAAIAKATEAS